MVSLLAFFRSEPSHQFEPSSSSSLSTAPSAPGLTGWMHSLDYPIVIISMIEWISSVSHCANTFASFFRPPGGNYIFIYIILLLNVL